MHQPLGFKTEEEHLVCKLHKSLYGLQQSPRAWYACLHTALLAWRLTQSHLDPNLYFAHIGTNTVALLVYVNDILVTCSNLQLITQLKAHLHQTFKINDLSPMQRYLGVQFDCESTGFCMHQTEYAFNILHQFNMEHCTASTLLYLVNLPWKILELTICQIATKLNLLAPFDLEKLLVTKLFLPRTSSGNA